MKLRSHVTREAQVAVLRLKGERSVYKPDKAQSIDSELRRTCGLQLETRKVIQLIGCQL